MSKENVEQEKPTVACICSFCSQKIRVTPAHVSRRAQCPSCGKVIRLVSSHRDDVSDQLKSAWYYTQSKLLVLRKDVGPVTDEEFLRLFDLGRVREEWEVRSPELTGDQWQPLSRAMVTAAQEILAQRKAEQQRLAVIRKRREQVREENHSRVRRLIRGAIADGKFTSGEESEILDFAKRAKIAPSEIKEILSTESRQLLEQMLEASLDDGILEPDEEHRIAKYAKGLGVKLQLSSEKQHQVDLSRFAWQLNHSVVQDLPEIEIDAAVAKQQTCIACARFEWNEIVKLKRPKGVPLGDDRYLKTIGTGDCYLTDKQLILVTPHESKKARLSSVEQLSKHPDGIFLNRSTGKSLFLRVAEDNYAYRRFALALDWLVAGVVQAVFMEQPFLPEVDPNLAGSGPIVADIDCREPRFTFRVVGDHVGDRSLLISRLCVADRLKLVREPSNPYDDNAVTVLNDEGHALGYLKRDVAEWYGPRMDSGKQCLAEVHRIRDDGSLIVGVYE